MKYNTKLMQKASLMFVFTISLCITTVFSKTDKTVTPLKSITVDVDNLKFNDTIRYSDIFSGFQKVELETSDSCLIEGIRLLKVYNDTIYILDAGYNIKTLFVFAKNGKFIRKIGKSGKGIGRFDNPASFAIDAIAKEILILDVNARKICIYGTNGVYKREIYLTDRDILCQNISIHEGHIYLDVSEPAHSKTKYYVTEISPKGEVVQAYFPYPSCNKGWSSGCSFENGACLVNTKTGIQYANTFSDTIYSISNGKTFPIMNFVSRDTIPRAYVAEIMKEESLLLNKPIRPKDSMMNERNVGADKLLGSKYFWNINHYSESDHVVYFRYFKNHLSYQLFYYPEKDKIKCTHNLIDNMTMEKPSFVTTYGNSMVAVVPPALYNSKNQIPTNPYDRYYRTIIFYEFK